MPKETPKPPTKIDGGKYSIDKRLGAGCFGEVWRGKEVSTNKDVAVKCESRSGKNAPQLDHERDVISKLRQDMSPPPQGIVECYFFGPEGSFNCMVMDYLGKSLEDHVQGVSRDPKEKKFNVKTTVLIAQQVLQRIEFLHSKGYVHRDIKPENFMFGVKDKVHHVYIIDFGLSKPYWDATKNNHCMMKQKLSLTGTARYASINAHKGIEQSRRDDLEAIGHMFMYFLRGALPWSGLDAKTQEEKYKKICAKKEDTLLSDLCAGFPKEFQDYLAYARGLQFTDRPNYSEWIAKLQALRDGSCQDHSFQWFDEKPLPDNTSLEPLVRPPGGYPQPDDKQTSSKGWSCCLCGSSSKTKD
jgi:serine/threonine protein kinase|mmetsp:Transcript_19500/g.31261  ORF Transcript_19500/g.31261 Transcript_19500/m.31261 type:complete len:356 (+) Transcript_19500:45-1112(+)|eukprot:CAMPEP_0169087622 /NCGR_PEP_ID=MMETSP1015-20121227/14328_1 /TAXON_ID=342587 /ORGANISM="Karlodinium micrum, Strain CCMP2283" /LENGTH=355 /DNA_ID=CAMNT_0009147861 /DNA_START=44 /DNA_END=1111 /DNA_ORIENTATION=-